MINNKWLHGPTGFALPPIPTGFMRTDGIFHLSVTLDPQIGEEVVLIIHDSTDFIYQLAALSPFNFHTASVAVNTTYGPVYVFLFWVTDPTDRSRVFAGYDKPVNIANPITVDPWIKLSVQSHLHLFLVDANHEVQGFYEFQNNFGFDEAVDTISQLDSSRVLDFERSEREYFERYDLIDVIDMVRSKN